MTTPRLGPWKIGANSMREFEIFLHGFDKRRDGYNREVKRIDAVDLRQAKLIAGKLLKESQFATSVEIHDPSKPFFESVSSKTRLGAWEQAV